MASCSRVGAMRAAGNKSPRRASMREATSRDHAWKSVAVTALRSVSWSLGMSALAGLEILEGVTVENRDARLGVGELRLAELDELGAPLISRERFLERQLAVFHAGDERLELLDGPFEGG